MALRDLCSRADVKTYIGGEVDATTEYDPLIDRLVSSSSDYIHRRVNREFKAFGTNPQMRAFDVDGFTVRERELAVGDLATMSAIAVAIKDSEGTLVENADTSKLVALPRIREEWQPIDSLRFPAGKLAVGYVVEVTGTFGFPLVPEDVRQYAIAYTADQFARDVSRYSDIFSAEQVTNLRIHAAQLRKAVDVYRVPVVG